MPHYKILERAEESQAERILADLTRDAASAQLKIAKPDLFFIRQSATGEIFFDGAVDGFQQGRRIHLLQGLPPRQILRITAHEVRHVYQVNQRRFYSRERDCRIFEWEFLAQFRGNTALELFRELWNFSELLKTHDVRMIGGMRLIFPNEDAMKNSWRRQILGE